MLAPTRQRQLLEILNEKGSLRTTEVARVLGVTEETIRRDFEKLEKEGALLRAHGGVIRLDTQRREMPVKDRAAQNIEAKRAIARTAVKFVEPGQVLFLDPSTTVQQLARIIPDQPLTILTTSLQIPEFFSTKPSIDVILLGGHFRASSRSCIGYPAELVSDLFRIDAAFLSCRGIDSERGLSEATEDQARLKRHLLGRVPNTYLLADSSKAGVSSTHFFARNSAVDVWVTETEPDGDFLSKLKMQGIRVEVARSA